jgi:hypothetical protein
MGMPGKRPTPHAAPLPAPTTAPRGQLNEGALIAEAVWCWAEGPDTARLEALGWTDVRTNGPHEVRGTGPSGIRVLLHLGPDIYAVTASLALGQWGALWPAIYPTLLEEASRAARLYQRALNDHDDAGAGSGSGLKPDPSG